MLESMDSQFPFCVRLVPSSLTVNSVSSFQKVVAGLQAHPALSASEVRGCCHNRSVYPRYPGPIAGEARRSTAIYLMERHKHCSLGHRELNPDVLDTSCHVFTSLRAFCQRILKISSSLVSLGLATRSAPRLDWAIASCAENRVEQLSSIQ